MTEINIVAPNDIHFHTCEDCGKVWAHQKSLIEKGQRRFNHICIACGAGPYYQSYDTKREANEVSQYMKEAKDKDEVAK